uniref:Uncharacterized protein n=1 Tax=Sphaerodactylus townsendi TaxID=933632 RepID=A0ACB8ECK5_9SAUR
MDSGLIQQASSYVLRLGLVLCFGLFKNNTKCRSCSLSGTSSYKSTIMFGQSHREGNAHTTYFGVLVHVLVQVKHLEKIPFRKHETESFRRSLFRKRETETEAPSAHAE